MSDDIIIHNENMSKLESMSGDIEVYDSTFNMAKSMSGDVTVQNSEGGLVATMSGNLKLRGSNIDTVWIQSGEGTITSCNIDVLHMYNDTMYMNDSTINVIKTDGKYFVIPKGNKVNIVVFEYGGQVKVEDGYYVKVINGEQVQ